MTQLANVGPSVPGVPLVLSLSVSPSPTDDFPQPEGVLAIERRFYIQEPTFSQVIRRAEGTASQTNCGSLENVHMASTTWTHHLRTNLVLAKPGEKVREIRTRRLFRYETD